MNTVHIFPNTGARSQRPINLRTWSLKINDEMFYATGIDIKCPCYTTPRPEEGIRSVWRITCHPETITWENDYCILE